MYRPAVILPLLLLCLNCHAGCGVAVAGGDTISLMVGKDGCFRSPAQREAFAAELKLAVRTMEHASAGGLQRKSTADQLNGFGDLKRQARNLAPAPPVYYGQR
jgi:hypothetical protein